MRSLRSTQRCLVLVALATLTSLPLAPLLEAGFSGTDVFIPASARAAGASPSQFYSTLWITNLSPSVSANAQLKFFQRDTSNTSPITVPVTIAPGETKKYENVVQTVFGLPSASGAIRIQADNEVLASSRTYNLPPGSDIRDANGLFFTGIPQSLSIGPGETSNLQGVSQGGTEDFRYNFGMVETTGSPVTVRIIVRNSDGSVIGSKDYPVQAFEAKQFGVTDAAPGISTVNGRVDASVIAGSGAILLYGTGVANGSQDSIGFEMSYHNALLSAGVSSLNGLTGAVTLAPGTNVSFTPSGNTITINATGGGGAAGVSSFNGLTGAVTLAPGANIALTPSGNTITINGTGGGGVAGVSSVNGYVGAVNMEAGTNVSFGPASAGNGIKISATGGASGVTTLNGLSGAVGLVNGTGISLTPSGNNLTIAATGSSGVTTLNGLSGAVGLVTGIGISITPSGNNLTFAATGSGLTLPYSGSASTGTGTTAFGVTTPGTAGFSSAIFGQVTSTSPGGFSAALAGSNLGTGSNGIGVWGTHAGSGIGVWGAAASGVGVVGTSTSGISVRGLSGAGSGYNPLNPADKASGVWGDADVSSGVLASTKGQFTGALRAQSMATSYGRGVETYVTTSNSSAVYAVASSAATQAGYFQGTVNITGSVSKGGGSFKIDHPLDPENKYLYHSFVESPDMMNIYNGMVVLDSKGEALITLPDWFSSLNRDFRYQLTCVGGYAPVYVSREVEGSSFQVAGGRPGLKVSWQLTGVRQDAWANAHRIPVEELKDPAVRGSYLYPELFGQSEEKNEEWVRNPAGLEVIKQMREQVAAAAK